MSQADQREYARTCKDLPVEVRSVEGVMIEGRVRDMSLKGLSLVAEKLLPVGKECTVVLVFETDGEEHVRLSIPCVVARAEGTLMAVTYTELEEEKADVLQTYLLTGPEEAEREEELYRRW